MRKMTVSALIFAAALAFSGFANAEAKLDAQGKCRDNGKFVEAKLCEGQKAPAEHCRDKTTKKFAKCSAPNTEPVPEKPKAK
jgi:hypothetical protein